MLSESGTRVETPRRLWRHRRRPARGSRTRSRSKARRWSTWTSLFLVAACVVGPAAAAAPDEPAEGGNDAGRLLARVNGEPIYDKQVNPELDALLRKFRKYGMRQSDAALIERQRRRILERLIGEKLIEQESRKLTGKRIEERVRQTLDALEEKRGARAHVSEAPKAPGPTKKDVPETLRAKVRIAEYLRSQGISDPEIPEARIRETYDRNPQAYARKETVRVSHILIAATGDPESEEVERAKRKAETIRGDILNGRDFAALAREHSQCNSASGGGDLGHIRKGYMPPEFDQVAFSMKPGAISEVVRTKFGFHIIKVLDKSPGGPAPYEQVRGAIKQFLQQRETKKRLTAHIKELRKKSRIEILLDESTN